MILSSSASIDWFLFITVNKGNKGWIITIDFTFGSTSSEWFPESQMNIDFPGSTTNLCLLVLEEPVFSGSPFLMSWSMSTRHWSIALDGVVIFALGGLEYTTSGLNGYSSHTLKPIFRLSDKFVSSDSMTFFQYGRKVFFGKCAKFSPSTSFLPVSKMLSLEFFKWSKKTTSSCWSKCVEFGKRHTKLMLLSLHAFMTRSLERISCHQSALFFFYLAAFSIWKHHGKKSIFKCCFVKPSWFHTIVSSTVRACRYPGWIQMLWFEDNIWWK